MLAIGQLAASGTLTLPPGVSRHSIIVQGDAYIMASSSSRGFAVGGRLCDGTAGADFLLGRRRRTQFSDPFGGFGDPFGGFSDPFGTPAYSTASAGSIVASDCPTDGYGCPSMIATYASSTCACYPSDYGSSNSRFAPWSCQLESPVSAWTTSRDTFKWNRDVGRGGLPYDWSTFERLAQRAMQGTATQGGYTQHVVNQGGGYNRLSLVSSGSGSGSGGSSAHHPFPYALCACMHKACAPKCERPATRYMSESESVYALFAPPRPEHAST